MNSHNPYGMCAKCQQALTNDMHMCFKKLTPEQQKAFDNFLEERRKSIEEDIKARKTATQEREAQQIRLQALKKDAYDKLWAAEKAWYAYYAACEVGLERTIASGVYDNIRTATRR